MAVCNTLELSTLAGGGWDERSKVAGALAGMPNMVGWCGVKGGYPGIPVDRGVTGLGDWRTAWTGEPE